MDVISSLDPNISLRAVRPNGRHALLIGRSNQGFGGIVTYLADVASFLLEHGYRVTIAINEAARDADQLNALTPDVQLTDFPVCRTVSEFLDSWNRLLETFSPDILHFNDHNRTAMAAIPKASRCVRNGTRLISTLHGDIANLGGSGQKNSWISIIRLMKRRMKVRRFVSSFDRVISVSEAIGARLPYALLVPKRNIVCIANGVDIERFSPHDAFERNSHFNGHSPTVRTMTIGCSGGLYKWKGFDIAVRAIASVAKRYPIRLAIAGTGPEESSLRQIVNELCIKDKVTFLGAVGDMPAFIKSIDLLVCPSNSETSCFSQLEAMAAGLPSVCSRYADFAIRVRDGVDGFLVERGDVAGFSQAIETIISDAPLYRKMSRNARARVVEKYSRQSYLNATLGVYKSVLGGCA